MRMRSCLKANDQINHNSRMREVRSPSTFGDYKGWALALLLILSLCSTVCAEVPAAYYAGETYTFSTGLDPDLFIFDWKASCCSDPGCCEDPTCCEDSGCGSDMGTSDGQFVWTAPDVSCPTVVTISVFVGVKAYPACNGMAEISFTVLPKPSIQIEKATNGEYADTPTGPVLNSGDLVTWTYVVTNTGNVPLSNVYVTDDVIGPVAGPIELERSGRPVQEHSDGQWDL